MTLKEAAETGLEQKSGLEKRCTKCAEVRPLAEFRPNVRYKDGFLNHCDACRHAAGKAWYQRNKESVAARSAARIARHPERTALYCKRYRQRHPDRARASARRWQESHPGWATNHDRDYRRRLRAIELGKQQFGSAGHFLLVRAAAGYWHAMLPGRPIGRTEQIVARYALKGLYPGEETTWDVLRPDVQGRGTEALLRRLMAREERLTQEVELRHYEPVARSMFTRCLEAASAKQK